MKYVAVLLGKYLSEAFHINNDLKQEDAFFFLYCISTLLYSEIRKFRADEEVLKLNGTVQLLLYADDVNILVGVIIT